MVKETLVKNSNEQTNSQYKVSRPKRDIERSDRQGKYI